MPGMDDPVVAGMFVSMGDRRVCPMCDWLDGQTLRADDPNLSAYAPPLHSGCRCTTFFMQESMRADLRETKPLEPPSKEVAEKYHWDPVLDLPTRGDIERELLREEIRTKAELMDEKLSARFDEMELGELGGLYEEIEGRWKPWGGVP